MSAVIETKLPTSFHLVSLANGIPPWDLTRRKQQWHSYGNAKGATHSGRHIARLSEEFSQITAAREYLLSRAHFSFYLLL